MLTSQQRKKRTIEIQFDDANKFIDRKLKENVQMLGFQQMVIHNFLVSVCVQSEKRKTTQQTKTSPLTS